jgi:hypothetical protein
VERNEARAERDALAERLAEYQTREVERIASSELADPRDLHLGNHELADLLDADGFVDPERVLAAAKVITETRPGLSKVPPPQRAVDRSQGRGGLTGRGQADLGDAFRPELWK